MEYEVQAEVYENHEFDFALYEGDVLIDGDIEPDLMAQLVAQGVLVPVGAAPPDEPDADD